MEVDVDGLISNIYKGKKEDEGQLEEPAQVPCYERAGLFPSPMQDRPRIGNTYPADGTVWFPRLSGLF